MRWIVLTLLVSAAHLAVAAVSPVAYGTTEINIVSQSCSVVAVTVFAALVADKDHAAGPGGGRARLGLPVLTAQEVLRRIHERVERRG